MDESIGLILKAMNYAAEKHSGQKRKDTQASPYINHPIEVTDDKNLPKEVRKQRQVETAPHKSSRAKMLKIADKISNVQEVISTPPSDWSLVRRREYLLWSERVVAGLRGVNEKLENYYDKLLSSGKRALGI